MRSLTSITFQPLQSWKKKKKNRLGHKCFLSSMQNPDFHLPANQPFNQINESPHELQLLRDSTNLWSDSNESKGQKEGDKEALALSAPSSEFSDGKPTG